MPEDPPMLTWPFLRSEASTLGLTDRDLRSPRYRQVLRGVLVDHRVPDTLVTRARATLLLSPEGAAISHWTAARMWGGRVPDNDFVHVSYMRRVRFRVQGVKAHCFRYRLDTRQRHGFLVTTPLQTFCHMGRFLGLVDLVALGDSLVRKERFSPQDLLAYTETWPGQFRTECITAAHLVRERVDSSPETALRLLMVLAGLPEPEVDIRILDADGAVRFRIDLGYEGAKLAIEYDGRWHLDGDQPARDAVRREELGTTDGWTFVIVTADQLYLDVEALLEKLVEALRSCGLTVPDVLSSDWRAHFRVARVAA